MYPLLLHQDQRRGDHAILVCGGHPLALSRQQVLPLGNEPLLNFMHFCLLAVT